MNLKDKVYIDNRRLYKNQYNKNGLWSRAFSFNKEKMLWFLREIKLVSDNGDGDLKTIPGTELYVFEIIESARMKLKNLGCIEIQLDDMEKKINELIDEPKML